MENIVQACDLATKWAHTFKLSAKIRDAGVLTFYFKSFSELNVFFYGSAPTLSKLLKAGVDSGLIEKDGPQYRLMEKYYTVQRLSGHIANAGLLAAANRLLEIAQNAPLLTALSDGEMCVGDLARHTGWAGSKVSLRCSRLHENGSLNRRRDDRRIYYSISDAELRALERVVKAFEGV